MWQQVSHTFPHTHYDLRNTYYTSALTNSTWAELLLSSSETLSVPRNLCSPNKLLLFFNEQPWTPLSFPEYQLKWNHIYGIKLSKKVTNPNWSHDEILLKPTFLWPANSGPKSDYLRLFLLLDHSGLWQEASLWAGPLGASEHARFLLGRSPNNDGSWANTLHSLRSNTLPVEKMQSDYFTEFEWNFSLAPFAISLCLCACKCKYAR